MKKTTEQMTRMERFVDTLEKQDENGYLMRKIAKWILFCVSMLWFIVPTEVAGNIWHTGCMMGMFAVSFTVFFPVTVGPGAAIGLQECLKYFPVGGREIHCFLRGKLLRFLGLYGGTGLLLQMFTAMISGLFGLGTFVYPFVALLAVALAGFWMIRVR